MVRYLCRLPLLVEVTADDRADAYDTLRYWADALADGDGAVIRFLSQTDIKRVDIMVNPDTFFKLAPEFEPGEKET